MPGMTTSSYRGMEGGGKGGSWEGGMEGGGKGGSWEGVGREGGRVGR